MSRARPTATACAPSATQQAKYLANLINGTSGDQSTNWNTADNLVVVGDFNAFT